MKTLPFTDQVVIITGASSGIGRALALQVAEQGGKVVLAARRIDLLKQAAAECQEKGGIALAVPTDVSNEANCKDLIARTIDTFGRLDMLVNNAGFTVLAQLEDYRDLSLFRQVMEVNFSGALHCTYHALPHLIKTRGRIVTISSLGGKAALPYSTAYVASKYALHGFFDSLRMEVAKHGVSVTLVCPYWVISGFHEAQMTKNGVPIGRRGRAIYTKRTMTAERCAEITLQAAEKRKREVLMNPGGLIKWLKFLSPKFLDWFVVKVILGAARRRGRTRQNATQS